MGARPPPPCRELEPSRRRDGRSIPTRGRGDLTAVNARPAAAGHSYAMTLLRPPIPAAIPPAAAPQGERGATRRDAAPTAERLTSVEAVLADAKLSPPRKLDLLTKWDARDGEGDGGGGGAPATGHGRVADAVALGFPDPAPYSPEVQSAIVELYRRHRDALPPPETGPWVPLRSPGAGPRVEAAHAEKDRAAKAGAEKASAEKD